MSDHNIYIRDLTTFSKPTQPRTGGNANTKGWNGTSENEERLGVPSFSSFKSEAVSQVPVLGKIGAVVAAGVVVTKMVLNVADKVMSYQSAETGRYSFYTQFNNGRKVIGNIFNPISSVENFLRATQADRLTTMRNSEQMKLLGDSVWNRTTRRV